jgi:hypothetical protein
MMTLRQATAILDRVAEANPPYRDLDDILGGRGLTTVIPTGITEADIQRAKDRYRQIPYGHKYDVNTEDETYLPLERALSIFESAEYITERDTYDCPGCTYFESCRPQITEQIYEAACRRIVHEWESTESDLLGQPHPDLTAHIYDVATDICNWIDANRAEFQRLAEVM